MCAGSVRTPRGDQLRLRRRQKGLSASVCVRAFTYVFISLCSAACAYIISCVYKLATALSTILLILGATRSHRLSCYLPPPARYCFSLQTPSYDRRRCSDALKKNADNNSSSTPQILRRPHRCPVYCLQLFLSACSSADAAPETRSTSSVDNVGAAGTRELVGRTPVQHGGNDERNPSRAEISKPFCFVRTPTHRLILIRAFSSTLKTSSEGRLKSLAMSSNGFSPAKAACRLERFKPLFASDKQTLFESCSGGRFVRCPSPRQGRFWTYDRILKIKIHF